MNVSTVVSCSVSGTVYTVLSDVVDHSVHYEGRSVVKVDLGYMIDNVLNDKVNNERI